MLETKRRCRVAAYLSGSVLILAGSVATLWLPGALSGALALFLLLKICWLEENIRADLLHATKLPDGYRRTQLMQERWQRRVFGTASEREFCPQRLASMMRIQSHALYAVLTGGCAAFLARTVEIPLAGVALGGAALGLAFARVDRLAEAEAIVGTGGALSDEMLEDRGPLARFMLNQ